MATVEFEGIANARCLGGIPTRSGATVKPGLIFRSGALNKSTEADVAKLRDTLGITCVVDLRTGWERKAKPDREIPGVENHHIPFYDQEKVGLEYVKPIPGSIMIGSDFACDPPDFYQSMANPLTSAQMAKAAHLVFGRALQGLPTLVHCSGGKDRAGIMSLVLLEVLQADRGAILEDYLLTNASRDKNLEPIYQRFLRLLEGDEERAREVTYAHRALPCNLESFYAAIDSTYGSMQAFIAEKLGIDTEEQQRIIEACTVG